MPNAMIIDDSRNIGTIVLRRVMALVDRRYICRVASVICYDKVRLSRTLLILYLSDLYRAFYAFDMPFVLVFLLQHQAVLITSSLVPIAKYNYTVDESYQSLFLYTKLSLSKSPIVETNLPRIRLAKKGGPTRKLKKNI